MKVMKDLLKRQPRTPEVIPASEEKMEDERPPEPAEVVEVPEEPAEIPEEKVEYAPVTTHVSEPPEAKPEKDSMMMKIEFVLEEDVEENFKNMPPQQQAAFRREGEELAERLKAMCSSGKFDAGLANKQITRWLRGIPDVNALFLEQAAKIKTDKLKHLS